MKIGKFSEMNNVSVDTIRHYMDLGLIVAEKQGGQYFFDSQCQNDLEHILDFKSMGFSLNETKTIFLYRSFSKLAPYQEDLYYRTFFTEKYKKIEHEIEELIGVKERLQSKLQNLSAKSDKHSCTLGIDIGSLSLFKCLKCSNNLILYDAAVNNNQIIDGKLKCQCGEEYIIDSGILKVDNLRSYRMTNILNESYIVEYINETDCGYLDNLRKGLEWGLRKMKLCSLSNKIVMELGSGLGFFLRYIYDELPADCTYIAVDHSMERHRFLKSLLEGSSSKRNIIFICSDFSQIPIRDRCIDMMLDISGTSNYGFEHEEFLLDSVDHYAKDNAYLFGSYILFKSFSSGSLIGREYRKNFILENIKRKVHDLRYTAVDERISDYIDKGGKYEDYFVEGEKIYTYSFFGKR